MENNIDEALQGMYARIQSKVVPNEVADKRQAERNAIEVSQKYKEILSGSGIPDRHKKNNPDYSGSWGNACRDALAAFEKAEGRMVCLLSSVRGSGKTQIAAEVIKQAARLGHTAMFCSCMKFFMEIKATYKQDCRETEISILHRYATPQLLVIDEYARRGETDWEDRLLFHLIDTRYNDLKDTMIISNQTPEQAKKSTGDSIVSRMNEIGLIIQCDWDTFRVQKQPTNQKEI